MNHNRDFSYLLQGYISGSLSDEEKLQLLEALSDPEGIAGLGAEFAGWYNQASLDSGAYDKEKVDKIIKHILAGTAQKGGTPLYGQLQPVPVTATEDVAAEVNPVGNREKKIRLLAASPIRYAAAAVVVLLFGVGAILYYGGKKTVQEQPVSRVEAVYEYDVPPGSDKAVLTLSNGQKVELNQSGQQMISDGEIAIRNENGALVYDKSEVVAFNTMTTPRGGQYKLKLPDGTLVWLNASSSITYPTAFQGKTREVRITGEAYFEVAKNPAQPFTVKTWQDDITVKGTSFNVNSYTDEEAVKTSLLEGMVEINGMTLNPGNAYMRGKMFPTDITRDLAWKNGAFNFHQVKLKEAMRQIARWYDVEISYQNQVTDIELRGEIGRNLTLQQVLDGLQDKDLHFKLEGKLLTVY